MATLYVTEFSGIGNGIAQAPKLTSSTIAISGASTQSSAFSLNTSVIRVATDAICSVEIGGKSPVATTASQRMGADQVEYFQVTPGDKIAVIANT